MSDVRVREVMPVANFLMLGVVAWHFGPHLLAVVFFAIAALLAVLLVIMLLCLAVASDSAGRRKDSP